MSDSSSGVMGEPRIPTALIPAGPRAKLLTLLSADQRREYRREIGERFLICVVASGLLMLFNAIFQETAAGDFIQLSAYNLLQIRLSSAARDVQSPVIVVDISRHGRRAQRAPGQSPAERERLLSLIRAIAVHHPRAIGVALDLWPGIRNGRVAPGGAAFFNSCLAIRKNGTLVYLGTGATEQIPEGWPGRKEYASLAASTSISGDTRKMLRSIQVDGRSYPSLAEALAESANGTAGGPTAKANPFLHWAVVLSSQRRPIDDIRTTANVTADEFLVDYSALARLEQTRVRTVDAELPGNQDDRFRGRLVLIGEASAGETADAFMVHGQPAPVPRTLLIACATTTLVDSPLYDLTPAGRAAIDFVMTLATLGTITLAHVYFLKRRQTRLSDERLETTLTGAMVVVVLVVGVGLVHQTRVLWDDFLMVAAGVMLEPPSERWLRAMVDFLRKSTAFSRKLSRDTPLAHLGENELT